MRRFLLPLAVVGLLILGQAAIVLTGVPWAASMAARGAGPVAGAGGSGAPPTQATTQGADLRLDGSAGVAHVASITAVRASSNGDRSSSASDEPAYSGPAYSYPVTWGTPISGEFGEMSSDWPRGHAGVDFNGDLGDPVYAATDGKVTYATYNDAGYGNLVMIMRNDGTQTRYAHLSKIKVKRGQRVHAGDLIGKIGATGAAYGAHLHFEVRVGSALTPSNPAGLWTGSKPGIPAKPPRWACKNFGC